MSEDNFFKDIDFFQFAGDEEIPSACKSMPSENVEIEIPDDFSLDELDAIDECMNEIPVVVIPKFVRDKDIPHVVVVKDKKRAENRCNSCGRSYKRLDFYTKHIQYCGRRVNTPEEVETEPEDKGQETAATAKQRKKKSSNSMLPSEHYLMVDADVALLCALRLSADDLFNNMKVGTLITPGNKVAKLAIKMIDYFAENKDRLIAIGNDIFAFLSNLFHDTNFHIPASREHLWSEVILHLKTDSKKSSFFAAAKSLDDDSNARSSLYYSVCSSILREIAKRKNEHEKDNVVAEKQPISDHEKQVIHYVAGYILFSIIRHFKSQLRKNPENAVVLNSTIEFLNSFKRTEQDLYGNSFPDFVDKWTKLVSRGYLTEVSPDMFNFILTIEKTCRSVLNIKFIKDNKNLDLRDAITKRIENNQNVSNCWLSLTRNCPNDKLTIFLKKQMVTKWVDIRAKAFVDAYIQILKRQLSNSRQSSKKKLSSSSQPSLRKTLH